MSKHNVGDVVGHSSRGNGTIIAARVQTRTPVVDTAKLNAEASRLRGDVKKIAARLEQIDALLASAGKPVDVELCKVAFADGKVIEFEGWEVDKLKERVVVAS